MTFELTCGLCQGRLLVETPGAVVECPHCAAHLAAPSEPSAGPSQPAAFPLDAAQPPSSPASAADLPAGRTDEIPGHPPSESVPPTLEAPEAPAHAAGGAVFGTWEPGQTPGDGPPEQHPLGEQAGASVFGTWEPGETPHNELPERNQSEEQAAAFDDQPFSIDPAASPSAGGANSSDSSTSAATAVKTSPAAAAQSDAAGDPAGVSRGLFLVVLSYASAVTLALVYLLIRVAQPNSHQLESLPDLPPPESNAFHHVREDARMAPHHTLKLGESRRFGNVRVTPLRVTREPLQLVHFNDAKQQRTTESPVLKLWLEFENLSEDQTFSPLDLELMLRREYDQQNPERVLANHFVCRADDKHPAGELVHLYPLNLSDSWDLKDHPAGAGLGPGEKQTVYIPTREDGAANLSGNLIWRVHFRKGLNPESQRGVTTVIEVAFHSNQIETRRSSIQHAAIERDATNR